MYLFRLNQMLHLFVDPLDELTIPLRRVVWEDFLLYAAPQILHSSVGRIARTVHRQLRLG